MGQDGKAVGSLGVVSWYLVSCSSTMDEKSLGLQSPSELPQHKRACWVMIDDNKAVCVYPTQDEEGCSLDNVTAPTSVRFLPGPPVVTSIQCKADGKHGSEEAGPGDSVSVSVRFNREVRLLVYSGRCFRCRYCY